MRYKPKIYAEALAEAILGKDADEKKILENFLKLLEKNRDMGKAKEIIALAEKIFIKKTGRRYLTIESARKIKAKQKGLVDSVLQKGDIVDEKINKNLLAEKKIIIDNENQFDGSMQKKLDNLFQ